MRTKTYPVLAAFLLACGAAACKLTLFLSRHGFSGYDVSPMIDAGWRVFSGQTPGRDFIVTFPASLYLLTGLSFRLFGVTWRAIALGDCWVYAVLLLLGLRVGSLVRASQGARVAAWMAAAYFAGQTILLVSINYLWHSALSESFAIYAVYATFALVASPAPRLAKRREAFGHLTLAVACLVLSKPNTAYPAILLCLWILVRSGVRWLHAALVLVAALALASVALARVHVSLFSMLWAYHGLTGRLMPKAFFNGILYAVYARYGLANLLVYAILAPAVCTLLMMAMRHRQLIAKRPVALLALGAVLISIIGMGTNFDFKLTDTPLAIMGLTLFALSAGLPSPTLTRRALTSACALLLLAMYFGRSRLRMQIVGNWADDKCDGVTFSDPFLGSIKDCVVAPQTLGEIDEVLATQLNTHSGTKVFFGPSLEFLYAGRRIQSPLHLPNWWDPGSSFPLAKSAQIAAAWKKDNFGVLIFEPQEDQGQLAPGIREAIRRDYVFVPGTKFIHVYQLKPR